MLPRSARTVRVLLTTCLSFSIALSALTPSPVCCAGDELSSTCCAAAPGACCCIASNHASCGMACCTASSSAVPEHPIESSKSCTDRPDAAAETARKGLVLVGQGVCARGLPAFDVAAYSGQSSLQVLRVRLDI